MDWILLALVVSLCIALLFCVNQLYVRNTENKKLKDQVELLNKAVSAANAGIFYYNVAKGETVWDENSLELFGLGGEQRVIDKGTWERLIHPEDRERATANMNNLIDGKGNIFKHSYRIIRPDGEERWISASGYILRVDNVPIELSGFHFDATRQRLHEQMLEETKAHAIQSMNAKGRFIANMSHEIRTPMNAIMGVIDLLRAEASETQMPYIETLKNSSDVLLRIINDVLDLSQIEAGKFKLENQPVELRKVISQCLAVYKQQSSRKRILLAGRVDARVPLKILADSARLQQVLMNLISNAFKFTDHGQILLRVDVKDEKLVFSVCDTGIGISEENLDQLFNRFSQADATATRKYGGTGLGLSIAKEIVELWGGEISVNSKLAEGTSFTFTMPCLDPELAIQPSHDTVLFCTASKILVDLWQEDSNAPAVIWVKNVAEFNNAMALPKVDRLVVDCRFPEASASDLASKVRNRFAGVDVTFIGCDSSMQKIHKRDPRDKFASWPLLVSNLWLANKVCKQPKPAGVAKKKIPDFSHITILGVDDNATNLLVLSGLLKRFKVKCLTAESGKKAIELAGKHRFDMVLMDYDMPEMDGLEATRRINAMNQTLVIGLSAHVGEYFENEALTAGMAGFLTKPINQRDLEKLLLKHFKPMNDPVVKAL
ncbi:PAS domain-containing hybrid sensor histidine kinase/response regulator [Reinekea marinisedimentorum]|uniref:histidine kinase n=1 Tax=Reinekea marinisedimentorum TaxID=230495 RepID=A0A4R3HZP6_9GAMM|nr:PAS domain-containing hybrid sensor histidine kinase/response regulator [Reinekea marinisedimentorum]TCS38732.1 PAS domain S-box-containing protein [Reinekea marinisedimentorum]